MIDWHRIRELKDEVGDDDFAEVAELFLEEVEEIIERLEVASNVETLEADFHSLKGSALNLGFRDFAALCEKEERRAAEGNAEEIIVTEAIDSYRNSRELFIQFQDSEMAA